MDHANGPEFSPDFIPEPIKPDFILDEDFYSDVLGRPRTADEINQNESFYIVKSIEDSLARLSTYDGWRADGPILKVADMRVVVAMHGGAHLMLLEDLMKRTDPFYTKLGNT